MYEEKEHIYISKKLADEYKKFETVEEQERIVKEIINRKRLDIEGENELLSESMIEFKSICLKHRKELKKVYDDQAEQLYQMWEEIGDTSAIISKKIDQYIFPIASQIKALSFTVENLKKELESLNIYGSDNLVRLAERVSEMDEKTKDILRDLLNSQKIK